MIPDPQEKINSNLFKLGLSLLRSNYQRQPAVVSPFSALLALQEIYLPRRSDYYHFVDEYQQREIDEIEYYIDFYNVTLPNIKSAQIHKVISRVFSNVPGDRPSSTIQTVVEYHNNSGEGFRQIVNNFVEKESNGEYEVFLKKEEFDADAQNVVVSLLQSIEAFPETPFDPNRTAEHIFHGENGDKQVMMMEGIVDPRSNSFSDRGTFQMAAVSLRRPFAYLDVTFPIHRFVVIVPKGNVSLDDLAKFVMHEAGERMYRNYITWEMDLIYKQISIDLDRPFIYGLFQDRTPLYMGQYY